MTNVAVSVLQPREVRYLVNITSTMLPVSKEKKALFMLHRANFTLATSSRDIHT